MKYYDEVLKGIESHSNKKTASFYVGFLGRSEDYVHLHAYAVLPQVTFKLSVYRTLPDCDIHSIGMDLTFMTSDLFNVREDYVQTDFSYFARLYYTYLGALSS